MKLNFTYSLFFCAVIALSALPPEFVNAFPPAWKPWLLLIGAFALAAKSHFNLFINPDGTDARVAWNDQKRREWVGNVRPTDRDDD